MSRSSKTMDQTINSDINDNNNNNNENDIDISDQTLVTSSLSAAAAMVTDYSGLSMTEMIAAAAAKTSDIQRNLLDLISTLLNDWSPNYRSASVATGSGSSSSSSGVHVSIKASIFESIQQYVPRVQQNVQQLQRLVDKQVGDSRQLADDLAKSLRREQNMKRQLETVRQLYGNLREEYEWLQISISDEVDNIGGQQQQQQQSEFSDKPNDYLRSMLALVWSATRSEATVRAMIAEEDNFRQFMSTMLQMLKTFVLSAATNSAGIGIVSVSDNTGQDWPYDSETIESICGVCINVFANRCVREDEVLFDDWHQWINCFLAVQRVDQRFIRNSLMALFNASFNRQGQQVMSQSQELVGQLAGIVVADELRFDYTSKTLALKIVHKLILDVPESTTRLRLVGDLCRVLPIKRIQELVCSEPEPQIRDELAQMLASIGHLLVK